TGYNKVALLHNDGGKFFRDVTKESGIKTDGWSTSAAWGDVDNDGKLDLYVCRYVDFGPKSRQVCTTGSGIEKPTPSNAAACPPTEYHAEIGILYRNDGNGRFTDVTKKWGLDNAQGNGLGAAFADFDGSGRQSLFVANDQKAADFYVNEQGHFKQIARSSGTAVLDDGTPYGGMGVDWGDYMNDGRLDLAVMDFMDQDKNIFHNEGNDLFSNRSVSLGMHDASYPWVTFGAKWIDYDNDGWLDLITSQAGVSDTMPLMVKTMHLPYRDENTFEQPTVLYHNVGGTKFLDVSGGLVGKARRRIVGRGLAIGDYDNDGRMDVLVVDSEGKPLLLHNETPNAGHWLIVRLVGVKSNRDGLGALIRVTAGDLKLVRLCQTDGSYMSASDKRVHIGLGQASAVQSLAVQWPGGHVDKLTNITADQIITIVEGKGLSR
ncbi:MAG TPA: CRTAC1 family protein, partial [Capsulimonadaceae bacterium]|nr:CRTAC1 family protein [Capsulimonadaceae bacterium]